MHVCMYVRTLYSGHRSGLGIGIGIGMDIGIGIGIGIRIGIGYCQDSVLLTLFGRAPPSGNCFTDGSCTNTHDPDSF